MKIEEKATRYATMQNTLSGYDPAIRKAYIEGAYEALQSQWIDPNVELPEISHNKTVYVILKDGCVGLKYQSAYYVGNGVFRNPNSVNLPVIAWMHIPQLPKPTDK